MTADDDEGDEGDEANERASTSLADSTSSSENISAVEAARLTDELGALALAHDAPSTSTAAGQLSGARSAVESPRTAGERLSEWSRFTSDDGMISTSPPHRADGQLFDDLVVDAFDDYDETPDKTTLSLPIGPPTFKQHVRRVFCRVRRHNERALQQRRNDTPADYVFHKTLGEGAFSNVLLATRVATDEEVAIKMMEKRRILRERKTQYVTVSEDDHDEDLTCCNR